MVSVMLGRDHALLGGVGFLLLAPVVLHDPTWQELGVGCVTSAAFALLPDIDEPGSTVSRKLGPISRSASEFTNKIAGGHRQATHSLLFVGLVALSTWLALFSRLTIAILVAASFLLVFRMLLPRVVRFVPLVGIGSIAFTFGSADWAYHLATTIAGHVTPSSEWLLLATAGGCLWHLVGDTCTVEGVPYLWLPGMPALQSVRVAVPIVGHTGSARESLIGGAMGVVLIWLAAFMVLIPASHSIVLPSFHVPNLDPLSHLHIHLPSPGHLANEITNKAKSHLPKVKLRK